MNKMSEKEVEKKKYLTFSIAKEIYGIDITKVIEIIGAVKVTPVPKTPESIKGVINLRGSVIPVIEVRRKFGMDAAQETSETCIIVVEVLLSQKSVRIGVVVDSVSEVLEISLSEMEASPSFGVEVDSSYIESMAKKEGNVIILLKIEKLLTDSDEDVLKKIAIKEETNV